MPQASDDWILANGIQYTNLTGLGADIDWSLIALGGVISVIQPLSLIKWPIQWATVAQIQYLDKGVEWNYTDSLVQQQYINRIHP